MNILCYQNKGQGLSYDNFELFIFQNLSFYNLDKKELLIIFNNISNNKKFINLNDLKTHFYNNNNNTKLTENNFDDNDFYDIKNKTIKKFLIENFSTYENAFQIFKDNKDNKNDNENKKDYITIKEFYNEINNLFPKKYDTQTILNYFQKIFKKNINELNKTKYNEFKEIYFKKYKDTIGNIHNFNFKKIYNAGFNSPINTRKNILLS